VQLHKHDVVAAATAILDDYGIADLTMRRLARELNVTPGALYWHFANKQQLLGAVADRILQPACHDAGALNWPERNPLHPSPIAGGGGRALHRLCGRRTSDERTAARVKELVGSP
jgi:AcrR family transcriptional regulator